MSPFFSSIILIALTLIFYTCARLFVKKKIPKGLKPVPLLAGWPLVGNALSIKGPMFRFLHSASDKYGPIFSFRLGMREIIVLNSNKVINQTLKDMGNNFSGRWQNIVIKTSARHSGILGTDRELWATQRSFALKVLRDFGLGKQRANEIVRDECAILLKEIKDSCGKEVGARFFFPKFTVNVISKLVMNMRFEREDPKMKQLIKTTDKITQKNDAIITLNLMFPILEKLPGFSKLLLWCIGQDQDRQNVYSFLRDIIDKHRQRFIMENEGEDLIDMFLREQYQLERDNVKNHTFTEWQLIRVVFELFIAGYDTTATTLTWSMILLARYQNIQNKVYQEIVDVIGSNKMPELSDKKSLNYTQAVIDEIYRYSSVLPLSLTHRVLENTELDGYFIPKDSLVFPNFYACHRDKAVWEKPFEFYPEHFLTVSDSGGIKYKPRIELLQFSIGKRQCLGESLARLEVFIFLVSILQRFKIRFGKDMDDKEFSKITHGSNGVIRAPSSCKIVFETRG